MRLLSFSNLSGVVLALVSAAALALTPPPPLPEDRLVEFYQAMDGDNWFNNDGWLDPDTSVCDWYGITCRANPFWGFTEVAEIALPDNNLTGTIGNGDPFDADVFDIPAVAIDLSGNRIEGPLDRVPFWLGRVDLSRNLLSGRLPAAHDGVTLETSRPDLFSALKRLDLSSNRFQGTVPEDWSRYQMDFLNLANNELDGGIEHAFAAIGDGGGNILNLADNLFFGPLDPIVRETELAEVRGLNLCWNSLEIDDPALAAWIDTRHIGGANWADCMDRDREIIDAGVSGSWFVSQRSGEGISLHLLKDDRAVLYAFTFDLDGKPMWLFNAGRVFDRHIEFDVLWQTGGDFGFGLRAGSDGQRAVQNVASKRIDRLDPDRLQIERQFIDVRACQPLYDRGDNFMPCPINFLSDRFDNSRLTRLAGTRCEGFNGFQQFSGAWFDPQRNGEGFMLEVLEDRRFVVYWFTHQPDGSGEQVWMMGLGEIARPPIPNPPPPGPKMIAGAMVRDVIQPRGGVFGPDFDPEAVERIVWGDLQFSFFDDGSGEVEWDSLLAEFGAGRHPLVQITQPRLAECPAN